MSQQLVNGQALWAALSAVAGFITDKTGIPVLRGSRPSTDSRAIYIPKLADGLLTREEVMKVIAYIYHECAHILQSDFSIKFSGPLQQALAGILEDVRIEQYSILNFPAARMYLNEMVRSFTEAGLAGDSPCFPVVDEHMSMTQALQWYMLYRLRHDLLQQSSIAPLLNGATESVITRFGRPLVDKLDAVMFTVRDCQTERDVLKLADEIIELIKEEQQNDAEQRTEEANDESTPKPSDTREPGVPDAGEPSPLEQVLSMGSNEITASIDDILEGVMSHLAQDKNAQLDIGMPNYYQLPLEEGQVDMSEIKASINAVRTKTRNWMHSAAQTEESLTRSGMVLSGPQLWSARIGGNVFIEESEGVDLNAAVSIVIDRSGSMQDRIKEAVTAALSVMLAYDIPGIKTRVTVFPVNGSGIDLADEGVAEIKRWNDSAKRLASKIASLDANGGTPMAEAILSAASNIMLREETLRMILVVTDGKPRSEEAAIKATAVARRAGLHVVGLGIGHDPQNVFGEEFSVAINGIDDLSSAMVKMVKAALNRKQ